MFIDEVIRITGEFDFTAAKFSTSGEEVDASEIPIQSSINQETASIEIAGALDSLSNEIYEHLNSSILSGEYVTDIDKFDDKIKQVSSNLDSIGQRIEDLSLDGDSLSAIQNIFIQHFFLFIKKTLTLYRGMLNYVKLQLDYDPNVSTISSLSRKDESSYGKIDSAAKKHNDVFTLNIELSRIDHSLSYDVRYFEKLILIRENLNELKGSIPQSNIVLFKCEFLLYKLIFRLTQSKKNYAYFVDFKLATLELKEIATFDKFNAIIKGHYDTGLHPNSYTERFASAQRKFDNKEELNLDEFHSLTKYFKDEAQDLSKLKRLKERFDLQFTVTDTLSKFDKKSIEIASCYMENNILSLELEKGEFTLENWEDRFIFYTNMAENYRNKNFFPYYKILKEFIGPKILECLRDNKCSIKKVEKLIRDYEQNLTKLIENIRICEKTHYLPFQNVYSECKIHYIVETQNVEYFIASSFVLPLNYKEKGEDVKNLQVELTTYKSMCEIRKMIDEDRASVDSVKKEIERTDRRHIEILSIFAAIVMFVSNEVQIFSKVSSIKDALLYSLFFTFGIGTFVLLIWFITRPYGLKFQDIKFSHWALSLFFVGGFSMAFYYLFYGDTFDNKKRQLEQLQFKIDSLKQAKQIDSLVLSTKTIYKDTSDVGKLNIKNLTSKKGTK